MTTRVYRYGLLPPTENAELVAEQISRAHRYYNTLVEIERERRDRAREILGAHPTVEPLGTEVEKLASELAEARAAIKAQRRSTRSRSETADMRQSATELRQRLRDLRIDLKTAKAALRDDAETQAALAEVNDAARARQKQERAACGVYWGSYQIIEEAIDAARKGKMDPKFRRWDWRGAVGVQLMGGLSVSDALDRTSTGFQIDPLPPHTWETRRGRRHAYTVVRMRVGSDGRAPIWAEWPLLLHRPLPDGATIMRAKIVRDRIADRDDWSLHITMRMPARKLAHGRGAVALDLGWRKLGPDHVRAGYLRDDKGHTEEIRLSESILPRAKKLDDLASIRDLEQDRMRTELVAWMRDVDSPEWFTEATAHLPQWRSPSRFSALWWRWKESRWPGDGAGFEILGEWRKRDKHLWLWHAAESKSIPRHRREEYRRLGKRLVETYQTLVVEKMDLREVARKQAPEYGDTDIAAIGNMRRLCSPGDLREILIHAFADHGGTVAEVEPAFTTRACHACGTVDAWDAGANLRHVCSECKAGWDQDDNACRNLLTRYFEHLGGSENAGVARVKDYGARPSERESKWARLGRHSPCARKPAAKSA